MTARSPYWIPATVLVLVAIVGWHTGWIWPLMLCFAIGLGPWFAAAKVFDDNVALRAELERRDREDTPPAGLTDRMVDVARDRARLRIVEQPTGEHDRLAMSRAEWEAIERETEGF